MSQKQAMWQNELKPKEKDKALEREVIRNRGGVRGELRWYSRCCCAQAGGCFSAARLPEPAGKVSEPEGGWCLQAGSQGFPSSWWSYLHEDTAPWLPVCVWVRVCVSEPSLPPVLSGREPTHLFGSFIVRAVGCLINHWVLWEVHWRIDPGFSVWTYQLGVYRRPHRQLLWLSDSDRRGLSLWAPRLTPPEARSCRYTERLLWMLRP